MCGEQFGWCNQAEAKEGSPPRVRGTGKCHGQADDMYRITPACAGNSMPSLSECFAHWDHPRVCGEQTSCSLTKAVRVGSPPRVRGTAAWPPRAGRRNGITPACAGNSATAGKIPDIYTDHPRVCGEQKIQPVLLALQIGSPPRVRGTGSFLAVRQGCHRITPACAGNSYLRCAANDTIADHPRVCGEQFFSNAFCTATAGSPPRVRGTGITTACISGCLRITPACAGNSLPD